MLQSINLLDNMKLSFVIPCYNEELNLQKGVLDKVVNFVKDNDIICEVIIVDDGSSDQSAQIVKKNYLPKFPKLRLIENKHGGKAMAVITGIRAATGSHVVFLDMDLATPIEETRKMIKKFNQGADVVIGSRDRREGAPFLRQLQSRGFVIIRDLLINLQGVTDTQCGFKGFSKPAAIKILDRFRVFTPERRVLGPSVSAGFDLEFLYLARKLGYVIEQIPVEWRHVETKRVNFIKDSLETLADIAKIKQYELTGKYS